MLQLGELDAALDSDAAPRQLRRQQPFRLVLRQAQRAIGQAEIRRHLVAGQFAIDEGPQARRPQAGIDHAAGDAHPLPDLERPRRYADGPAIEERLGRLVDDAAAHAMPRQIDRQTEPGPAPPRPREYRPVPVALPTMRRGRLGQFW